MLLRHWRLLELRGLRDDAERARDEVLAFLDGLAGASTGAPERRAAH